MKLTLRPFKADADNTGFSKETFSAAVGPGITRTLSFYTYSKDTDRGSGLKIIMEIVSQLRLDLVSNMQILLIRNLFCKKLS